MGVMMPQTDTETRQSYNILSFLPKQKWQGIVGCGLKIDRFAVTEKGFAKYKSKNLASYLQVDQYNTRWYRYKITSISFYMDMNCSWLYYAKVILKSL